MVKQTVWWSFLSLLNLNKNGSGFLRVPGLGTFKIRSFRDGSRALFVPGAWWWL